MKTIYWNLQEKEILFKINWLEYFILKRIFYKRKYTILKPEALRGKKINCAVIDESARIQVYD